MISKLLRKYNDLTIVAKATLWFTICNFIIKGIGFITGPIFTRLIPEDEYGKLTIFLSYEQIILIFSTWEIQLGAYQKGIFKYKEEIGSYTTATLAQINSLTIGLFVLIFLFRETVSKITQMPIEILAVTFIYLMFYPAYSCWMNRRRKAYKYKSVVFVTLLYTIVSVIVPLVSIIFIDRTAVIKYGSTLVATGCICLLFYIKDARLWNLRKVSNRIREFWGFNFRFQGPGVLHSLSYLVLSQADRIMIGSMIGNSQAGFYGVAYSIATAISLIQTSLTQSLTPWRYQMLEDNHFESIKKQTNILLIGFGGIILSFIIIIPEVVNLLFPKSYYEAIWCIPPISCGVFFMFLYSVFVNIEAYYEKTVYVVLVSVPCGLINIVLNYVCIKAFGYIACAYTTLFSYILFAVGHYYFMEKILKQQKVTGEVVDKKKIVLISIIMILASICVTLLYPYAVIRYALFVGIIIFAIVKRNQLRSIIEGLKQ